MSHRRIPRTMPTHGPRDAKLFGGQVIASVVAIVFALLAALFFCGYFYNEYRMERSAVAEVQRVRDSTAGKSVVSSREMDMISDYPIILERDKPITAEAIGYKSRYSIVDAMFSIYFIFGYLMLAPAVIAVAVAIVLRQTRKASRATVQA